MDIENSSQRSSESTLTPERAVRVGQLVVNLPVIIIIGLMATPVFLFGGPVWGIAGAFGGPILGWIWWSFSVPRWREWAKEKGADEELTQALAVRAGLVWPKDSFFEKTEFRRRKKS
jgi:hypothetical protein